MQNQDSVYSQIGDLTEETVQKLEQSGLRMTVQRRHIIDILTKSQCTSPKEQIGVLAKTRNLGINRVMPQLGVITDVNGQVVRPRNNVQLSELIRLGLISHGVIGNNNKIEISLVGESINIVITS